MVFKAADSINMPVDMATIAADNVATWNFLPSVSVLSTSSAATNSVNKTVILNREPARRSGLINDKTVSEAAKTPMALATVIKVSAFLFVFQALMASPRDVIIFLTPSIMPLAPSRILLPLPMKFLIALRMPRPMPAFIKL